MLFIVHLYLNTRASPWENVNGVRMSLRRHQPLIFSSVSGGNWRSTNGTYTKPDPSWHQCSNNPTQYEANGPDSPWHHDIDNDEGMNPDIGKALSASLWIFKWASILFNGQRLLRRQRSIIRWFMPRAVYSLTVCLSLAFEFIRPLPTEVLDDDSISKNLKLDELKLLK